MSNAMYQVICREHGKQALTEDQYTKALGDPDVFWKCPVCGEHAEWDDDSGVTSGDADMEAVDDFVDAVCGKESDGEKKTEASAIKVHIMIEPGGIVTEALWPDPRTNWKEFSEKAKFVVGGPTELVAVLFNDKPATMIVNEVGASTDPGINPAGQLPVNARATAIYWTGTIKGITQVPFNPLADPLIHGPAILFEVSKRDL